MSELSILSEKVGQTAVHKNQPLGAIDTIARWRRTGVPGLDSMKLNGIYEILYAHHASEREMRQSETRADPKIVMVKSGTKSERELKERPRRPCVHRSTNVHNPGPHQIYQPKKHWVLAAKDEMPSSFLSSLQFALGEESVCSVLSS